MSLINAILILEELSRYVYDFWVNFGGYIIQILIISIVLIVFWILLGGKYEDKRRLFLSLSLIVIGLVLAFSSPYSKELNTLIIGALFSPLLIYIIGFLKANKKVSDEIDRASHDYRWKQVERQSNLIGELLGELSTHAAAFKSYGIQEVEVEKWNSSFKVGLISDIHTLLVARYYYFVPLYNGIVKKLNKLLEQYDLDKMKDCLKSFSEVKRAFLDTETAIFHTLIYDLGLLQQKYLARPTVEFPLHMGFLLRKRLERFKILKSADSVKGVDIFSNENLERFNLKMVAHLNFGYANIGMKLKVIKKKLTEVKKNS